MIIKINGEVIKNIKRGFVLNERLDEELDTAVIIFYNSREEEYDPMSLVEVFITNNITPDYYFLVDTDQSLLTSKDLSIYQHTVSLIEPTKKLERYMVDNLSFTQPINTLLTRYTLENVLERINAITPLEVEEKHTATRTFSLDQNLLNSLDGVKAPQFYFSNFNYFQVLSEILKYQNSIPRISNYTNNKFVINKEDFNKILNIIDVSNGYNEKARNKNNEFYVNKLQLNIENGITDYIEKYPSNEFFVPLTTENYVATTNDIIFITPRPIYEIKSFKVLLMFHDTQDYANSSLIEQVTVEKRFTYRSIDLTNYLFEEQIFNTLPLDNATYPTQRASLVYKQGDNKIVGFGMAYSQFWGLFPASNFEIILDKIDEIQVTRSNETHTYEADFSNWGTTGIGLLSGLIAFKVEYYPFVNQRVEVQRETPFNNNDMVLSINQAGKSLDISRLLTNTQTTLDRMGNGDLILEKTINNFNDRFKIGQVTADNYIVTSVENTIDEGFFQSKAILTKNFNRLSQFVGVDREVRQYEIPFNEVIPRNLIYSEYIVLSTVPTFDDNASYWTSSFITQFRNMFRNVDQPNGKIDGLIFQTKDHLNNSLGYFILPVATSYYKNSLIFNAGFQSNTVGLFYPFKNPTDFLSQLVATKKEIRYTYWNDNNNLDIKNGTFEKMSVYLVNENIFQFNELIINTGTYLNAQTIFTNFAGPKEQNGVIVYNGFGLIFKLSTPYVYRSQSYDYVWFDYILVDTLWTPYGVPVIKEDAEKEFFYNYNKVDNYKYHNKTAPTPFNRQTYLNPDFFSNDFFAMRLQDLIVKKDPSEVISMTYQLHIVPKVSHIIIGETMAKNSPYLTNRFGLDVELRTIKLYRSTEYYRDGDTFARPSVVSAAFTNFTTEIIQHGFYIDVSASLTGYNSWAIADDLGNLYFGVNRKPDGTIDNRVFIQFKNKL
jgi:hypothetical protein